jgi:site-specific DNA-methyltransferase (adenine-specific)
MTSREFTPQFNQHQPGLVTGYAPGDIQCSKSKSGSATLANGTDGLTANTTTAASVTPSAPPASPGSTDGKPASCGLVPDWQTKDGAVRLYLGDCREVMAALPAESVDMIWTDPPFGHGNMEGDLQAARVRDGVKGARVRKAEPIANDGASEMRDVVDGMLKQATRILSRDCCCCCCCCCGGGGPKPTFAWVAERMDAQGLEFFHAVVWDKSARGDGMGWRYRRNYEFVMVAHRRGAKLLWADNDSAVANIVRHVPVRERRHPNEKPLGMVQDFIRWHTTPGDVVCDPFMGSGTTIEACIRLERKAIGIELDAAHFAVAVERAEAAVKAGTFLEPAIFQKSLIAEDDA